MLAQVVEPGYTGDRLTLEGEQIHKEEEVNLLDPVLTQGSSLVTMGSWVDYLVEMIVLV